jgi:hypothetical protein
MLYDALPSVGILVVLNFELRTSLFALQPSFQDFQQFGQHAENETKTMHSRIGIKQWMCRLLQ